MVICEWVDKVDWGESQYVRMRTRSMTIDWMGVGLLLSLVGGIMGMVASVSVSARWPSVVRLNKAYLLFMCILTLVGFIVLLPFLDVFGCVP